METRLERLRLPIGAHSGIPNPSIAKPGQGVREERPMGNREQRPRRQSVERRSRPGMRPDQYDPLGVLKPVARVHWPKIRV